MFIDSFYISFFNRFKKTFGKKALGLSQLYITFLESALIFLLISFFAAFAYQMKIDLMSPSKATILAILLLIGIYFKNWMKYNGKKRHVLNAKSKSAYEPLWKLIIVPLVFIGLSVIFLSSIS